jgi:hypothetical protein
MKLKLLGTAVAAALLGLSSASFAQPSGQDTPSTNATTPGTSTGTAIGGSSSQGTGGRDAAAGSSSPGSSADCDNLKGSAKARCERQHSSTHSGSTAGSTAGSSSAPVTQQPAQSGPGTVDRDTSGQPSGGTSSAGSK